MSRRRNSSVSDSFSRRSRSGSTVQTIALNVPATESRVDLENLGVRRHQISKTKSYSSLESQLNEYGHYNIDSLSTEPLITYPLTSLEKENLWLREVESLKYDYVIDPEDEDEADNIYHAKTYDFMDFLENTSTENKRMLTKSQKIIDTLNKLLNINEKVSAETLNFQEKSDHLLSEVNRLGNLYEELSSNLVLFESLDGIVKSLNTSSSGAIVASSSFNENILKKLDKCLAFVNDEKTSKYKEVAIYRHRFTQCMIRSLSLIKNHIINGFKSTEIIIHNKIREEKVKLGEGETKSNVLSSAMSLLVDAFLYSQFPSEVADLKPLIIELYERTSTSTADEFTGLLNDCYNQYFYSRSNLLNYVIKSHMEANNLKTSPLGIVQFAQSNIAFFVKLMKTELELFKDLFFKPRATTKSNKTSKSFFANLGRDDTQYGSEYFDEDDSDEDNINNDVNLAALNQWFESLLEPLYFLLRNRIIRESSIGDLCELISILQTYSSKEDVLGGEEDDEEYERSLVIGGNNMYQEETNSMKLIDFETLFKPILQDAQTRLVFRVQAYVEKNIVKYQRTGKELQIGNRRQMGNPMTQHDSELDTDLGIDSSVNGKAESVVSIPDNTVDAKSQALQAIYPPVVKSVKLLTKIYQLLNQGVFDDLANSVVHLVILSMRDNFSKVSGIEPKLYQIKNLMFFGEYIATFDIEYTRKETNLDFSGLRNLFRRFYRGDRNKDILEESYGASKANDSFLTTVWGTVPKVVDDYIDCRAELQLALRNAVHEFIQESGILFTKSLLDYSVTQDSNNCKDTIEEFTKTTKTELPRLKSIILSYITDTQVLIYLIDGVQEAVIKGYEQFYEEVEKSGNREEIEQLLEIDSIRNLWTSLVSELFEDLRDIEQENGFNDVDDISVNSDMINDDLGNLSTSTNQFDISQAEDSINNSMMGLNLSSSENKS